jgi:hypothetical protein
MDRYLMAETQGSMTLALTGIRNAVRVKFATDRQSVDPSGNLFRPERCRDGAAGLGFTTT